MVVLTELGWVSGFVLGFASASDVRGGEDKRYDLDEDAVE
jgi:hypothetical protein